MYLYHYRQGGDFETHNDESLIDAAAADDDDVVDDNNDALATMTMITTLMRNTFEKCPQTGVGSVQAGGLGK